MRTVNFVSFEEQITSKDKCTSIFLRKIQSIMLIILKNFCNAREKCLRIAYCMKYGMFSFECSLV